MKSMMSVEVGKEVVGIVVVVAGVAVVVVVVAGVGVAVVAAAGAEDSFVVAEAFGVARFACAVVAAAVGVTRIPVKAVATPWRERTHDIGVVGVASAVTLVVAIAAEVKPTVKRLIPEIVEGDIRRAGFLHSLAVLFVKANWSPQ